MEIQWCRSYFSADPTVAVLPRASLSFLDAKCRNPHGWTLLSPGPSLNSARRIKGLFQLPSGVTHSILHALSLVSIGNSAFALSRTLRARSRANQIPEPRIPMVNESTLPFLLGISLSGNRNIRCRGSHVPRIPEPRTPMPPVLHSCLGSHTATSSSGLRGSRIHDTSSLWSKTPKHRTPNADVRDLMPRVPP